MQVSESEVSKSIALNWTSSSFAVTNMLVKTKRLNSYNFADERRFRLNPWPFHLWESVQSPGKAGILPPEQALYHA